MALPKKNPRRNFLKQLGVGIPALTTMRYDSGERSLSPYRYPPLQSLTDACNAQGQIAIRLEIASTHPGKAEKWKVEIQVEKATLLRTDSWFFDREEDTLIHEKKTLAHGIAAARSTDILVVWVADATDDSILVVSSNTHSHEIQMKELVDQPELNWQEHDALFTVNLLQFHELGEIAPEDVGINVTGDTFRFAIMADPQGGDPSVSGVDSPTRMKIHNAFIEESIKRVNELNPQPAFTVVNGDFVDSKGEEGNFLRMIDYFQALKSPLLLELGNHETAYSAKFTPGYNMQAFAHYFAAQKRVNGVDKLLYSFNLGRWHFIVWPDPLRRNFWQTHPHYFDWLEKDLETYKDRPTIFIHHVPLHPIGINPLINYVEEIEVRRLLLDILTRFGNVKYVFSGHVHIPLKASLKTARIYKGMKMINLPAAGFRPRGFGEQDFDGGPSQGIAYVDIEGEEATISFQHVTKRTFTYPESFPELEPKDWPLWFTPKWELPAPKQLVNGGFEAGFEGWNRRFVYQEDDNPSNVCEIRRRDGAGSFNSLYLFCTTRPYMSPGQDRLPQTINRICQAVSPKSGSRPLLQFSFQVERANFDPETWAGAFVWIEGFDHSHKKCNLLYTIGKSPRDPGGWQSKSFQAGYQYVDLPANPGRWQQVTLNLASDFEQGQDGKTWSSLPIDRLVINLGVWTQNDRENQRIGISFDDLKLAYLSEKANAPSTVDNIQVQPKKDSEIYNKRVDHIAGEHVLYTPF